MVCRESWDATSAAQEVGDPTPALSEIGLPTLQIGEACPAMLDSRKVWQIAWTGGACVGLAISVQELKSDTSRRWGVCGHTFALQAFGGTMLSLQEIFGTALGTWETEDPMSAWWEARSATETRQVAWVPTLCWGEVYSASLGSKLTKEAMLSWSEEWVHTGSMSSTGFFSLWFPWLQVHHSHCSSFKATAAKPQVGGKGTLSPAISGKTLCHSIPMLLEGKQL